MVTESLATSISLTWDQPQGSADAVDSYEINYSFTVNNCPDLGKISRDSIDAGSMTTYTLTDSPDTPVEEDSEYTISVTAFNSAGRSEAASVTPSTPRAGLVE